MSERERIKLKYRDGNGEIKEFVEPSSAMKRTVLGPLMCLAGFIGFNFWQMLLQPSHLKGQAAAPLIALEGLIAIGVAVPTTLICIYCVVGFIKPDWVWREPL